MCVAHISLLSLVSPASKLLERKKRKKRKKMREGLGGGTKQENRFLSHTHTPHTHTTHITITSSSSSNSSVHTMMMGLDLSRYPWTSRRACAAISSEGNDTKAWPRIRPSINRTSKPLPPTIDISTPRLERAERAEREQRESGVGTVAFVGGWGNIAQRGTEGLLRSHLWPSS